MKIRTGFVSNSSSSSYIIIVPLDLYEKLYSNMDDYDRKILNYVSKGRSVLGVDCMVSSYMSGNIDSFEDFDYKDEYNKIGPYDTLDNYQKEAKKDSRTFIHYEDC